MRAHAYTYGRYFTGLVVTQHFTSADVFAHFFQNALGMRDAGEQKRAATNVATTSERILEQMNEVVGLYEKSARDVEY